MRRPNRRRTLTNVTVEAQAPQLATLALQMSASNTAVITFTATPDHILQGTQHLARLRFRAVPGQTSAFVPLHITSLIGTRAGTSLAPTPLAKDGRVVVVGTQPLLEPILGSSLRQLMIYWQARRDLLHSILDQSCARYRLDVQGHGGDVHEQFQGSERRHFSGSAHLLPAQAVGASAPMDN